VPEDVSVVGAGGINLAHTICPGLTRVRNNLELVGQEAVEMVIRRIRLDGISLPGVVVQASFMGGATTRADENELLEIGQIPHRRPKKKEAA
jgi:DNA-binding LacI/PurR family transcriptional regulator